MIGMGAFMPLVTQVSADGGGDSFVGPFTKQLFGLIGLAPVLLTCCCCLVLHL